MFFVVFRGAQDLTPIFILSKNMSIGSTPSRSNVVDSSGVNSNVAAIADDSNDFITVDDHEVSEDRDVIITGNGANSSEVSQQSVHLCQMATFLLKLKEVRTVSQTAIDGLIDDVSSLMQQIVSRLQTNVSQVLQTNGLNVRSISGLLEVFSDPFITHHSWIQSICKNSFHNPSI